MPKQVKWDSSKLRRKVKGDVAAGMQKACIIVRDEAVRICPVDTQRLRSSLTFEIEKKGKEIIGRIGTNVEYSIFVEYGTSRMAAQPYLRPALAKNKRRIKRLLAGK